MIYILEDTRQQTGKHKYKHEYWKRNNIMWMREKLTCGDYQLSSSSKIAVDTKFSILELISDVTIRKKPKKEIRACLEGMDGIRKTDVDPLYDMICDDDYNRFPEFEIDCYCNNHGIREDVIVKVKDLYEHRHGFFHRGLLRAKNRGTKLFVLVENEDGVTDLDSLRKWVNPRRTIMKKGNDVIGYRNGRPVHNRVQAYPNAMVGAQLATACQTMEEKYGCKFLFCKPTESGKLVWEILNEKT